VRKRLQAVTEVRDRSVERLVVGLVHAAGLEQTEQDVGELLTALSHFLGELPVLPDARSLHGEGQAVLDDVELVPRGDARLSHGLAPSRAGRVLAGGGW
jgi:hypothetical protein